MKNWHDAQQRFRPRDVIGATFVTESVSGRGVVVNLARDGIFIRTPVLLTPGASVRIKLLAPGGRAIEVTGQVRWNTAGPEPGDALTGFAVALRRYPSEYSALVGRVAAESYATSDKD